ncbi:MAG: hypothetical protein INR62_07185 [Rhodospirillales bacterium]|nr:hypothetical protein [Acetobacter sp.]
MSEEDRRELIARQHRALYGDNSSLYESGGPAAGSRPQSQDIRVPSSGRGASPLAFDPYSAPQSQQGTDGAVQMPPRDRTGSTASPVSGGGPAGQQFGLLSDQQQQQQQIPPRTSESSPRASPPLSAGAGGSKAGVAPIGTRPTAQATTGPAGANKRSTTPLTPSGLSHGFNAEERSTSAASNPPGLGAGAAEKGGVAGLGSWGGNAGGVWGAGPGKGLAVQPSVWG